MVKMDQVKSAARDDVLIVRHKQVRQKLQVSSAKLFDMVARGLFPRPFAIVPGGRAVGWLESDVDAWILDQKLASTGVKSISEGQK
jgi:prophage regulatory protein